jgi:hypothetical protein
MPILNSVSPVLKQQIDKVITATGGTFAEVAVMARSTRMTIKSRC